jgi:putative ubiquitin-RnfH superfamily antitoxin RatB of RatAB toxin-antitoxin module
MNPKTEAATMEIEIARVEKGAVRLDRLVVPAAATLAQALELACGAGLLRSDELGDVGIAVFGQRRAPEEALHPGDRIELLGPLRADPKLARQRRVAHRRATDGRDKWRAG